MPVKLPKPDKVDEAWYSRQQGGKKRDFVPDTFINVDLSESEKADNKAWIVSIELLDNMVMNLVDEGYQFTLNLDTKHNTYGVFMKVNPKMEGHPHKGFLLSGRGTSPLKALKQVLYKHYKVLDGQWGESIKRSGAEEIDD